MPTTTVKNILYRFLLPFAPRVSVSPLIHWNSSPLNHVSAFSQIIRHHHISGGAFLFSSPEKNIPAYTGAFHSELFPSSDCFFRVASITKMATALLSFRLQDLGLLDLSAPVTEVLTGSSNVPELQKVTILHLLSHTSGLSDPPELESLLIHGKPYSVAVSGRRTSEPGTSFHYSNLGFGLLGCIFESVLNLPLSRIYQDFLFTPLSMNASIDGSSLPESRIMPVVRILPYHPGQTVTITPLGRHPLTEPDPLLHYGHSAGSMYTDIFSLQNLLNVLILKGTDYLSERWKKEIRLEHASYGNLSPTLSYGLGLLRISDPALSDGMIFGHQGFAYGCVDGAFWEENTGCSVIMLNGGAGEARTGRLGLLNRDILRWAFRKELPAW